MLYIKYAIYQSHEEYSSMLEGVICDDVYDVAYKLIEVGNSRISDLIHFMLRDCNIEQEAFIDRTITEYVNQLAESIIEHYKRYRDEITPIDEIPDFQYLDNCYVHKFVIELDD